MSAGAMGMMHEGYFVGRKELISWVQQYFQPAFSKVEECASGVVYCQIIDNVHPGAVPMSKVKMNAKTEVEFIHNFKILQTAFSKKRIDRHIDVDKLSKRSFQTNMEFLQFMKCYWDMHAPNAEGMPNAPPAAPLAEGANAANMEPTPEKVQKPAPPKVVGGAKRTVAPKKEGAEQQPPPPQPQQRSDKYGGGGTSAAASSEQQAQLALEVTELKMSVENLERERDFYYSKLREVEVLCQTHEAEQVPFLQQVLEILYKTDDADEFVTPEELDSGVAVQ